MYYYLTSAMKRRAILELQQGFSKHPIYDKIVPFIQNKYAFTERPQMGIVVKGSSANKVSLSGDNFVGNVESHVMLAYVGAPTYPIEWVREDLEAIRHNGDVMPVVPGIYYLEILTVPTTAQTTGTFVIDPLLTVTAEPVLRFITGIERQARLEHTPLAGTVRLWVNGRVLLKEEVDYSINYTDGRVTFLSRFAPNDLVVGDYRFPTESLGPVEFAWNTSDFRTLPGVVLAFGKRARVGDKVAIRVTSNREHVALAYGGKFEVSLDLDVISQDANATEEIADLVFMIMWAERKPYLENEGIEIVDLNIGGEADEVYDEDADLFYYTASLSLQFRADWEIHVPLPLTFSKITQERQDGSDGLTYASPSNLFFQTFPAIVGRNNNFERIT